LHYLLFVGFTQHSAGIDFDDPVIGGGMQPKPIDLNVRSEDPSSTVATEADVQIALLGD
jgi:hypothetical protein